MKTDLAVRIAMVVGLWAASAVASEGPEGMGDMDGIKPLLIIIGGVAAMAVVIWLGLKLMNRSNQQK